MKIYIVQKGDTLFEIAKKHGVALADLEKMNPQLKNPDKIMPGMKIKVPTGAMHVKKKEVPVKKEMPFKKEMPVNKENVVNKAMPKENPINKEIIIKEEITINKEAPVKVEKVEEKPVEIKKKEPVKAKIAPKEVKKPIFKEKEKTVEEPAPVKFKHTNVLPPTLPLKEENLGKTELAAEKGKAEIPMMDDPFPNMITPKKDIGVQSPGWQYPYESYTALPQTPMHYQGLPMQTEDPAIYGGGYSMPPTYQPVMPTMPPTYQPTMPTMPPTYQPTMPTMPMTYESPMSTMPQTYPTQETTMPTAYDPSATMAAGYPASQMPTMYQAASPCGCGGQGYTWYPHQSYQGYGTPYEPTTYTPAYSYGEPTTYGTTTYPEMSQGTPTYSYGAGAYPQAAYPQAVYPQQQVWPAYPTTQGTPGYPQTGMPTYGVDGYRDANGTEQPYQPNFPKWGDDKWGDED